MDGDGHQGGLMAMPAMHQAHNQWFGNGNGPNGILNNIKISLTMIIRNLIDLIIHCMMAMV